MNGEPIDLASYRARRDFAAALDRFEDEAYRATANGFPVIGRHAAYVIAEMRAQLQRASERTTPEGRPAA